MRMTNLRAEPVFVQVPDDLFEKLLERFPKGELPRIENCFYLLVTPAVGEPYVIPDFVIPMNLPTGWKTSNKQDLQQIAGNHFAPNRGSKLKAWASDRWLKSAEFCVGFVAWLPHPETEKPWLFKEHSSLIKKGGMPDFKYGPTMQAALEQFL